MSHKQADTPPPSEPEILKTATPINESLEFIQYMWANFEKIQILTFEQKSTLYDKILTDKLICGDEYSITLLMRLIELPITYNVIYNITIIDYTEFLVFRAIITQRLFYFIGKSTDKQIKNSIFTQNKRGRTSLMLMFSKYEYYDGTIFDCFTSLESSQFKTLVNMKDNEGNTVVDYFTANYINPKIKADEAFNNLGIIQDVTKAFNEVGVVIPLENKKTLLGYLRKYTGIGGKRPKHKSNRKKSIRKYRKNHTKGRKKNITN